MPNRTRLVAVALISGLLVQGCVRLVSPFSADLEKRASDMVAEVAAWDVVMRNTSGPIVVVDVQKSLAKWNGEVVAMAGIAAGLDPGVIRCDRLVGKLMGPMAKLLPADLKAQLPTSQPAVATSPSTPPQGCEASLFTAMSGDLAEIQDTLISDCGLPAVKDDGPAAATAPPTANLRTRASSPPAPVMTPQCRAWFGGNQVGQNGPLVDNLLRDLHAVVYLETRKNSAASK